MSFDTLRVKVGRKPVTIVELDLDSCANTYGVAPCTAAVGVTGAQKCFNTFNTCQDAPHYQRVTKTYKLTTQTSLLPVGENVFPCVLGVDMAPVQIDSKGFTVSGSVTIDLQDFPHHDRGIDPYYADRAYNPERQGTFFGKLRGRNKYVENRVLRVREGYVDASGMIESRPRTYFIDRIEGPDANGKVRIIGKDALRFADADKAKVPTVSKGSLIADIDQNVTSLTLSPTGVGAEYPASGTVRIDDEIIIYAEKSGDTLSGLTRGGDATTRDDHSIGTKVQLCVRYQSMSLPQILYDLLVTRAGLDSQYVPIADWQDEAATWLGSFIPNVLLSEPTGVKELIKEIIEGAGFALWWDDIAAQVRFKAIVVPLPTQPPRKLNEDEHFLAGSITVKDLPKDRSSQIITYFLPTGVTMDLKPENFRAVSVQVDAVGEGDNAYGTSNARTILSRWTPSLPVADEVGVRLLKRFKDTPHQVTFTLDAKDIDIRTGDLLDISSRLIQSNDGTPRLIRCLVTESRPLRVGSQYQYTVLEVADTLGAARLIAPDGTPDWTSATTEQKNTYIFISGNTGLMSDGAAGPTIT